MNISNDESNEELELLKSINKFYNSKRISNIEENDSILIKYLKNEAIIKDSNSKNLLLFINELSNQINKGNNIILPFIDPCYNIIEAYINSNINKERDKINEIFRQLIENSFINRKILIPIYAYFTELYSDVENITESDEKLNNFSKIVNLWNLFYSYKPKNNNNINSSSFCFLGSGLELNGIENLPKNINLKLKINSMKNECFLKYIDENDDLFINDIYKIQYSKLSEYKNKKITYLQFLFKNLGKQLVVEISICINKQLINIIFLQINKNKKINVINNFYGKINSIEISIYEESKSKSIYSEIITPIPLKDNKGVIFSSEYRLIEENQYILQNDSSGILFNDIIGNKPYNNKDILKIELKVKDINLVKVNYINYYEKGFNIIDYFGGITQFLPFLNIINGLYRNNNIQQINNVEKGEILYNFTQNILIVFIFYLKNSKIDIQEYYKKYWNFYLYIINKIPLYSKKINLKEFLSDEDIYNNIIFKISYFYFNHINSSKIQEIENMIQESIKTIYKNNSIFNYNFNKFGKTNNQLYRNTIKQLFVYNRLWSKQYLFFKNIYDCYKNKNNKNLKIKYKRINYYTANFQQPLIYPILEINNYYPKFTKFNSENLYKQREEVLNYDFSLDKFENNLNNKIIENCLDNNNIYKTEKCCLIKKMYHIKGEIGIFQKSQKDFTIIFSSCKINEEKCNKKNDNKNFNSNLCYGSVFSCLEKDKKRLIILPKDKIMFAIIRVYYYSLSGLEIFTIDNKSYYFNFRETISLENNQIISTFNKCCFDIKLNNNKFIGYYNYYYSKVLNPLFSEKMDQWNNKKFYYSNFDKLMIINLFSNRSFNDLNQYPVFPMLYNQINDKKRDMGQPIGFQELTDESKKRKDLIMESYQYEINANINNEEDNNEISYFCLFFSNITYTCNYLIRVFPYSFIGIEYQGYGFDDPNRLFFSIKSTFNNTLKQRSDLRELIPEMFYFPPLFYNINELQLKKLSNNKEIDNVIIQNWEENKLRKYIFLKDMREDLEKEDKLNLWIDLIFGINMEYRDNEGKKERLYNKNNFIKFKTDEIIIKDDIIMQRYDFGVLPFQLFNDKFPNKPIISNDLKNKIFSLNKDKFKNDHIKVLYCGKESFFCKGEKGINKKYLKIVEKIKNHNNSFLDSIGSFLGGIKSNILLEDEQEPTIGNNIKYLFVGDVFGNLLFYEKQKIRTLINDNKLEIISKDQKYLEKIKDDHYKLIKSVIDHTSEIKYIDYNPRLNLVIDYALDGYLNMYTVPKFKLILSIQTKDFNINEIIKYVVLISNPFPMICCIFLSKLIVLDINGKLINKLDIEKGIFEFCIDKNCGFFNDFICIIKNGKREEILLLKEK